MLADFKGNPIFENIFANETLIFDDIQHKIDEISKAMFKRKVYDELLEWKRTRNGECAVLLEGARCVGKTTIALNFAKNEYKSYIFIDFAEAKKEIIDCFEDIGDLDLFFLRIQNETGITLYKRESLIIFDEVQFFPRARQAIKYLVKDGRYDYIETGSFISIRKNVRDILIPSEEMKIQVNPMDYEEFCLATGFSYTNLTNLYACKKPVGDSANRALIRNFRMYLAVGGMPQAVEAYVQKRNFSEIDQVKREIIKLYENDLQKIDPHGRLSSIFKSAPAQLMANKRNFAFKSSGIKGKTSKDDERIRDLADSKIINISRRISEPSLFLDQAIELNKFKMYLLDTGLFVTMLFNDKSGGCQDIYSKLLSNDLSTNLGYLYENAIAQMLVAEGRDLYYYVWPADHSNKKYKIDFLCVKNGKVIPVEVKSNRIKEHTSIDAFKKKYRKICGERYLFSAKDYRQMDDLVNLPYYLVPFLFEK